MTGGIHPRTGVEMLIRASLDCSDADRRGGIQPKTAMAGTLIKCVGLYGRIHSGNDTIVVSGMCE